MKKILFFVTEDWYFYQHRMALAKSLISAGYQITLLTNVSVHKERIEDVGIKVLPIKLDRASLNPLRELKVLFCIYRAIKSLKPDIVHNVALKPVLYGGVITKILRINLVVQAIAGLGYIFSSTDNKAKFIQGAVKWLLKRVLSGANRIVLLQNRDDEDALKQVGVLQEKKAIIIRGSGIDLNAFSPKEYPTGTTVVTLVSRMLVDKGVREYVEAARLLRKRGVQARFLLVGDSDHKNPASIKESVLSAWNREGSVEWLGRREDIAEIYAKSHVVCLPSYREGLPKSLLEAAACGRAIVTTDVAGCRDVVSDGVNGILVPPKNVVALASALQKLIEKKSIREEMGVAGRAMAELEFGLEKIVDETIQMYRSVSERSERVPVGGAANEI